MQEAPGPQIRVCPLYAGLPPAKQLQVWRDAPPGTRKIVLSTNIAEASVTIPRIKYVIDTGVVKERWVVYYLSVKLYADICRYIPLYTYRSYYMIIDMR